MSQEQLIQDNMGLVYHVIQQKYPTFIGDEDLIQSGMVGLCKAAESFDPTVGKFSTFAYWCILNEIRRDFVSRFKHKGVLSLDYPAEVDGEKVKIGDIIVGDEDVGYVDLTDNSLTNRQKEILDLYQRGLNGVEIASVLGISRQSVCTQKRRIRIKLLGRS